MSCFWLTRQPMPDRQKWKKYRQSRGVFCLLPSTLLKLVVDPLIALSPITTSSLVDRFDCIVASH
jgi:hypothetical protein